MFKEIKNNLKWSHYANYVLVIAVFIVTALLDNAGALNSTNKDLLVKTGYYAILAVSLNLIVGFLGELSLGHAALMCVGAYGGGILAKALVGSVSVYVYFPLALIAGAIAGAVLGGIMGLPSLRLRGDYVAIITLAITQIVKTAADNLSGITGGASGMKEIPIVVNYKNCMIVLFVCLIIVQNFIKSKHGRAVKAIRDNVISANACGVSVKKYKIMTFVLAGAIAGIGGALAAMYRGAVYPNGYTYNESINILVMVVFGGMGSVTGSLIAAAVLTFVPQYLKVIGFTDSYRMVAYAVILIGMMILTNWEPYKRFNIRFKTAISNLFSKKKLAHNTDKSPDAGKKSQNENEDILLTTEAELSQDDRPSPNIK